MKEENDINLNYNIHYTKWTYFTQSLGRKIRRNGIRLNKIKKIFKEKL